MGLVNRVVPLEELEEETVAWCREMLELSPFSLRLLKASFNAAEDGLRRDPAAGPRREPPLLRERGGAGGQGRLPREAPAGLRQVPEAALSHLRLWLLAARPRTLPAAIAPVLVGTALAGSEDTFRALPFVAALVGSVFIQIGTNLSNDYSDARRGADTEDRLGPVRVTAGGLMPPRRVLVGTYVAFGVAVAAGLYLAAEAGWELLVVGVASILAGVLYTGGPRPYGYEGLGELFVFAFFGLVAVAGSYFVQTEELRWEARRARRAGRAAGRGDPRREQRARRRHRPARRQAHAGGEAGPRACADAVRRDGGARVRRCRVALVPALSAWLLLALAALPLVPPLIRTVTTRTDGPALNGALAATGRLLAVFSLLLAGGRPAVVSARVKRSVLRLSIPLKEPFVTSGGVVSARELLLLRLEARDGDGGLRRGRAVRALRRRAARARRRGAHRRRRAPAPAGARRGGDRPARPPRAPGGAPARGAAQGRAAR